MGLTEDLAKVRARRDEVERQRARREADLDLAIKRRDEALVELAETFLCDNVEEAERLLAKMRSDVTVQIADVEAALETLDG